MVMHFDISNSELLVLQVMQSHVQSDYSMDTFYWWRDLILSTRITKARCELPSTLIMVHGHDMDILDSSKVWSPKVVVNVILNGY